MLRQEQTSASIPKAVGKKTIICLKILQLIMYWKWLRCLLIKYNSIEAKIIWHLIVPGLAHLYTNSDPIQEREQNISEEFNEVCYHWTDLKRNFLG